MRNIDFEFSGVPEFTIEERLEIEVETILEVPLHNKEVTEIKNCNTSGYCKQCLQRSLCAGSYYTHPETSTSKNSGPSHADLESTSTKKPSGIYSVPNSQY